MIAEIISQPSSGEQTLRDGRERLRKVRVRLTEAEEELGRWKAELTAFENRYMRQVGVLYAELDALEARITEREVDLYDSDAARERAAEARRQAEESHHAAFGASAAVKEVEPPSSLKVLFREVAKRIHPDLSRDEDERVYFHRLMARANEAYRRGHADLLERMLDDQRELHAASEDESTAAEVRRVVRQIGHAERELAQLEAERDALNATEIAGLYRDAQLAGLAYRDLLQELAAGVREQISEAGKRFEAVDRQISAHGR